MFGVVVDPERLLVGTDRLAVLFELAVGRALVDPRLLCIQRIFVGKSGRALEGFACLLEAVDPHIGESNVDQFFDVDLIRGNITLVKNISECVGVDRVDLGVIARQRLGIEGELLVVIVDPLALGELMRSPLWLVCHRGNWEPYRVRVASLGSPVSGR